MTFEQLETFVRVARARSFSRAAVVLDLAQPTLSGRIAQLEGEIGAPLFLRRGRAVDLTEAGRALLPFAERMLALRAEAGAETRRAATGGLGRLIFGANPTCSQYLAPRLIERFLRTHPRVPVSLRTALSPALMEGLLDGALQLALCARAQIHVHAEVLWSHSDRLVVVASPDHPLALRREVSRNDLANHTILSTQAGPTRLGLGRRAERIAQARRRGHGLADPGRRRGTCAWRVGQFACAGGRVARLRGGAGTLVRA
jgi:DNA-binding transcriptional LysR family regulator